MRCPDCGMHFISGEHTIEECVVAQVHEYEDTHYKEPYMYMTQQEWDDIVQWVNSEIDLPKV